MLKKIKNILGIEGVKIELHIPDAVGAESGEIIGVLTISTQSSQVVEMISLKLVEKYKRGRNDAKLIDEYVLGHIEIDTHFEIQKGEEKTVEFVLPFSKLLSPMDRLERRNFLYKGLVKLAKTIKNVNSDYRVEATATVRGTALHPFISRPIQID